MISLETLSRQWQATRYAIDMIDMAWDLDPVVEDYRINAPALYEQLRAVMQKHRQVLCDLQDEILQAKYAQEALSS